MLVDSHCHLDFPDFADDLPMVIERAKTAGVGCMVTISTRVRRLSQILAIADAHPAVYCSVGTHPHNAAEEPDVTVEELVALAEHPKVVAIGEAGLDYHYDRSPRDTQQVSFRRHIAAPRLDQKNPVRRLRLRPGRALPLQNPRPWPPKKSSPRLPPSRK